MKDKIYTYQKSLYIFESPIHSSRDFVNCSAIWRFSKLWMLARLSFYVFRLRLHNFIFNEQKYLQTLHVNHA